LNRFKTAPAALCCRSHLSAPDAAAASFSPLPFAHRRWPLGPTLPNPICQPLCPRCSRPPLSERSRATAPVPCRPMWRCTPPPLSAPSPTLTRHRADPHPIPPLPHPASAQKGAARRRRALLSFSLPRSPPPMAKRACIMSVPVIEPPRPSLVRFRPPSSLFSPSTVRPTNPPPFPYLGPPSPL
jgi:hypothetical protein